ncbi:MAG: diphosphomevalonate decarboxylase, partial [Gammaproteobacteria bacterium]|nr:diphosphomevalonate decarboxylase [Gammaproteobacteria bacterium]
KQDRHQTERVKNCLNLLRRKAGVNYGAIVRSENNFPTGAGLASSASGFAALVTAASKALGLDLSESEISDVARRASGSAARSIFGGFVEMPCAPGDAIAKPLLAAEEWPFTVLIAVTSTAVKHTGSTAGMQLTARTSHYYRAWIETAHDDFVAARKAVLAHDFEALAEISERSCLKMHGVMMSAQPGLIYWNGGTIEGINRVRELRQRGVPVFFTIDAGPQLKAVCMPKHEQTVHDALTDTPGVLKVLSSALGDGARILTSKDKDKETIH